MNDSDEIPPERLVRRKAGEIPPISPELQAEFAALRDEDIDCSDIPERPDRSGKRVFRGKDGRLHPRREDQ